MKTKYVQLTNICLQFFCFTQITLEYHTKSLPLSFINYLWASVFFRVEKYLFLVKSDNVCEPNSVELSVYMRLTEYYKMCSSQGRGCYEDIAKYK